MGLDEVHRSLLELFPHINARALRAAATNHCKDVDAAVLAVLDEIIPFAERSTPSGSPLNRSFCVADSEASPSGSVVGTETEDDLLANTTGPDGLRIDDGVNFGKNEHFCNSYDGHHEGVDDISSSSGLMWMSASEQSCGEPVVGNDLNEADTPLMKIISVDQFSDDIIDVQHLDMSDGHLQTDYVNKESDAIERPSESFVSLNEPSVSESSEVCIVDLVVGSIQEARDNKKTLSTAMELVISLMRQVELKEQAAEQAKEEAGLGGKITLDKVEKLKRMLQYAKEANDMNKGIKGLLECDKAILETKLRELQSRVLSMSDERDKSLSVLDEMRLTLEMRLEAAENEIRSAEHEKLEMENAAQKLIADQELVMEKVVQESKILKQQAEDNAKLLEFLVDRGRVVDMLQGELHVICQDIRALKEKLDERVPLSKSPFSSQTSFISLNMDQVCSLRV